MKQTISVLVEGGKASPGPPLGPALGPLGVNIGKIVNEINEKTKDFEGMKVPVKIHIDPATKEYEIELGLPPTSALIKKELNIEKGAKEPGSEMVGNLTMEQIIKIAKIKRPDMLASNLKAAVKEVVGACVSMGVTIEEKSPKEILKEIENGTYDSIIKEE